MGLKGNLIALLLLGVLSPLRADDSTDPMMKAVAMDAGSKVDPSENKLFKQSIEATKESIARETLDVFYRDALDYYHEGRYDESLELLDKIYGIDPSYEDVASLRETITRLKNSHDFESKRGIIEDYMHQGNRAADAGQNVAAINFWKRALTVSPSYMPAKKKLQDANHKLAQKQYEAGYLYYHHGDMAEALDSWSNAVALDSSFKQRGLLLLMSKVELAMQKDRIMTLSAQGSQQYADKDFDGALQSYSDLLAVDSRNEEARRMTAKIKFQLGQEAYSAARNAYSQHLYAEAIKRWQDAIKYGFETQRSEKSIQEAEHSIQGDEEARVAKRNAKPAPAATTPAAAAQPVVTTAVTQANPEEANIHYRQGLTAIRSKDYHRALEELEIASELNPNDEHIYVARERAKQEWASMSAGKTPQ